MGKEEVIEATDEHAEEEVSEVVVDDAEQETEVDQDHEEEVITAVTIGDEEPPAEEVEQAPTWVKELRKKQREMQRENRELKERLKAKEQAEVKPVALGPEPKLSDFEYDEDLFKAAWTEWHGKKRIADEAARQAEEAQKTAAKAWQDRLDAYNTAKTKLNVDDFEEAEATVLESLDQTQQGIIIHGAESPELVILAVGKSPARLKELSAIHDPIKFAFAVAKLEKDLKVTKRTKSPPPPEKTVTGTAPKSGTVDSTLERLRAEADKTGDYSKVHKYRRQKRTS